MARKSVLGSMRLGVAVASWGAALAIAQAVVGAETRRSVDELDERIELKLKGVRDPAEEQAPEPSHDESFESWELVSV